MVTPLPALSVTLSQRRWACVLDLPLVLSEYGLPIVKQAGEVLDLWVVRELWHILDNAQFYLQQSQQLEFTPTAQVAVGGYSVSHQLFSPQIVRTLQEWDRLRMATDPGKMNMRWIGDSLMESFLPTNIDPDIIWRWEFLARSFDHYLERQLIPQIAPNDSLATAFRDALALAATLGSTPILTYRSPEDVERDRPPGICSALKHWKISCDQISGSDPIAAIEADQLRQLLVHAGFSKFFWAGLHLAVLHLVVPAAHALGMSTDWSDEYALPSLEDLSPPLEADAGLWEGARGFWYAL